MIYDPPSLLVLAKVAPKLKRSVLAAMDEGATFGVYFRASQGLRDDVQQNALWQKGRYPNGTRIPRGQPGYGTVTNARAGYSNHNFGCAVDCFPFLSGSTGKLELEDPTVPVFKKMVSLLSKQGLAWGGLWKDPVDSPHFQLPNVPVTPTDEDRALLAKGGLQAVWEHYNAL